MILLLGVWQWQGSCSASTYLAWATEQTVGQSHLLIRRKNILTQHKKQDNPFCALEIFSCSCALLFSKHLNFVTISTPLPFLHIQLLYFSYPHFVSFAAGQAYTLFLINWHIKNRIHVVVKENAPVASGNKIFYQQNWFGRVHNKLMRTFVFTEIYLLKLSASKHFVAAFMTFQFGHTVFSSNRHH